MKKQVFLLIILLMIFGKMMNAQQMDYEENLKILRVDYGTCYIIGNYSLCPETKVIKVGSMFGTAIKDCFGYFPDSTLHYDKDTLIIFAGIPFIDRSNLNIDWQTVQLLSLYRENYAEFTDGKFVYYISGEQVRKKGNYDKNTYIVYKKEKAVKSPSGRKQLAEYFYVSNNRFYYDNIPVLESFDVSALHIITSKEGYETHFVTDGKQVIFCGPTGGYSTTEKEGKEYVVVKDLIIEGVDLPSLRVLGKDLLADKNALYYCTNVIPFTKLNGFKFIIREL